MDEKFMEENEQVEEVAEEILEETQVEEENTEIDIEKWATELNDKYLRLMAEFDNFKKRSQKEKEDLFKLVVCDCVAGFLPVLDNLDRAVVAGAETEDKGLLDGVKLVQKQFFDTLTALGVEEIKTVGEEFNPELHNAVMHVEDSEVGANIIVEEFMKGYIYKGKVIRHSMVKSAN